MLVEGCCFGAECATWVMRGCVWCSFLFGEARERGELEVEGGVD